ncbi:MAG: hypothetical protein LUQ71_07555, partial [Methanoregula sp.]|nr:hypothetical protein [Methanoregula sp.]
FVSLETVTIGENSAMDPVLSLSVVLPDETRHTLGIVFPQGPKAKRVGERDEWATKIKEASLAAQKGDGVKPAELLPPWVAGELSEEAGERNTTGETQDEKFVNPPLAPRKPRAKATSGNHRIFAAAGVAIILIIVCVAGVYFLAPSFAGTFKTTPVSTVTPQETATVAATPDITQQPIVTATPQPMAPATEVTASVTTIPQTTQAVAPQQSGVWIRIEYNGNYTASYGTSGRMKDITGNGEQYYQIPAKDEIVDATVMKLDESGGLLKASIYNNGVLAASGSTTKPHGTVEIHADLRGT